ncbi:uncharacterized protein MELLADRAFT_36671, partial [Melampsora larici-populina 98AG31]
RKVLRKIDLRTIPCVMLLYLACFVDRSNIGNAKVAGLERDLHLKGIQFNIALSAFTITYVIVKIPSNHILRKVGAKIWLPFLVFCWGVVTVFSAFMSNYASLLAVRAVLGLCEGGLQPGVILYLSSLYRPEELQLRVGLSFCSTALSHILGGFLAFAIHRRMDGFAGKAAWSWIFIIEGTLTIFVAVVVWFFLCSSIETAPYLTPSEREFAAETLPSLDNERNTLHSDEFEWFECRRAFLDPQVWLIGLSESAISIPLAALSFFLPTCMSLVSGMGHTGAAAQLFSALPYIPALVTVIASALLADRWRIRGPIVLACVPVGIIGYLMLIFSKSAGTRYAAFFFVVSGLYPVIPCLVCIIPINTSGVVKRATCVGIQGMIQGLSILIAPFIYIKGEPEVKGHKIALGLACGAWALTAANVLYCHFENSRKASGRRDHLAAQYLEQFRAGKTRAPIGDRSPNFYFTL